MSDENETREATSVKAALCVAWLLLFGVLGALATTPLANVLCAKWIAQDDLRRGHALMTEQMEQIKRGAVTCLVQPDPRFIEELLADTTCAAKIREIDLGGDVSDERLGLLRKLPNLKYVVFLFARDPDIFLERLQGMATIEGLTLERTMPGRRGIELIGGFPKLKSLCLPCGNAISDLDGIKNHPSIKNLVLTRVGSETHLVPFLQSLPRLRSVAIEDVEEGDEAHKENLHKALPNCQCTVKLGP
ncbi:MAG: hypothetical protein ABSG53_30605 [Thermoguttaceae bacterium]